LRLSAFRRFLLFLRLLALREVPIEAVLELADVVADEAVGMV
jgi:hypothetical protein